METLVTMKHQLLNNQLQATEVIVDTNMDM